MNAQTKDGWYDPDSRQRAGRERRLVRRRRRKGTGRVRRMVGQSMDNNVEEEHYNANEYSKETTEEMK